VDIVLAYITAKDKAEAIFLSEIFLKNRLAACVNIIEGMKSFYWWEDKIEQSDEVILFVKTRESLKEALVEEVKKRHSYDCPCVLFFSAEGGNPGYLHWVMRETEKRKG